MKISNLSRRDFGKLSLAAFGGLLVGSMAKPGRLFAGDMSEGAEKHACCGLNECKGEGAGGKNDCAGTGTCATTKAHGCSGQNDCKNQGQTGENDCKGKGGCAVPVKGDAWKAAREKFEARMTKAGKKFGPAPDSCGKS
jgi:hypothetical protein